MSLSISESTFSRMSDVLSKMKTTQKYIIRVLNT